MTPTIAVVIPNRNDAGPLEKCLQTLLQQQSPPDQIIVVDDQSTDNSHEVMQRLLDGVAGVTIVHNPRQMGTMGALNEGLKHTSSEYVLFLSSNDYLEPQLFERARNGLRAGNFPGVWSAMVWSVDENGEHPEIYPSPVISYDTTYLPPERCIQLSTAIGHWFTGTTLVYHTETLRKIDGFDPVYAGLADMIAALVVASLKGAAYTPEPLGLMRRHDDGLMWRTCHDLPGLDEKLQYLAIHGSRLSPSLFTPTYTELMERRLRLTAIRTFADNSWQQHARKWTGPRYSLLNSVAPLLGKRRKLQLAAAFLLLRPPGDLFRIVRYRLLGKFLLKLFNRKNPVFLSHQDDSTPTNHTQLDLRP